MKKSTLKQLKEMYLMPFRLIADAMRLFIRNRNHVRDFLKRPGVANTLKYGMALTMLLWLVIALTTRDEKNNRLEDAIKQQWSDSTTGSQNNDPALIKKP